jgi:hypothetical protein
VEQRARRRVKDLHYSGVVGTGVIQRRACDGKVAVHRHPRAQRRSPYISSGRRRQRMEQREGILSRDGRGRKASECGQ